MKIARITAYVLRIPLRMPFRISAGEITAKDGVIFACESADGLVGWGEAAVDAVPFYAHETVGSVLDLAKNALGPIMKSRDWASAAELTDAFDHYRGNNFAKAGLELAFWDLLGKQRGQSCAAMLGGVRSEVETGPSIGIKKTPAETVAAVGEQLALGRRRIKIKVSPGKDTQYIRAVREAYPDITLMVDANNAYSEQDFAVIASWDAFNLQMIEQPLNEFDIYFHSLLKQRVKTPICLDESIHSEHDLRCAIALRAADIINIKVCRVGGLYKARRLHDICQEHGLANWIGSRVGFGVAVASRLAAASLPNCTLPTDAGPCSMYMSDDIIAPLPVLQQGCMVTVPDKPGLGVDILADKLAKYTTRKIVL
ncbi:MAG: o-succinylbenzoate synthase [Lentisphaeria bacterium]|nr:o-succinylbenzoate synthase [Lentisphaeria bacterium]